MITTIGLVDDHQLFLKSLKLLINDLGGYEVVIEAANGKELIEKVKKLNIAPQILLIDVNMLHMNGIETAEWCSENLPQTKLIALSMNEEDKSIIGMLKAGCCAYLLKDTHPNEFQRALTEVASKGFYNSDRTNINFRKLLQDEKNAKVELTPREKEFLALACSDLTYKQIASQMHLSPRTIDGYRESLFEKLKVQSRVGMCLEAISKKLILSNYQQV